MIQNVLEAVNKARELFSIKDFPGNLFTLLENQNYIERRYQLLRKAVKPENAFTQTMEDYRRRYRKEEV